MAAKKRTFVIVDFPKPGQKFGKFIGRVPSRAAKKAFSRLSRMVNLTNSSEKNFMVFTTEEVETGKRRTYIGTRVKLATPVVVNRNGRDIKFYYKNVISDWKKTD